MCAVTADGRDGGDPDEAVSRCDPAGSDVPRSASMNARQALVRALVAVRELYAAGIAAGGEGGRMLATVDAVLAGVDGVERDVVPQRVPACHHLPAIADAAGGGACAALSAAFLALEPHLRWTRNPNYSDQGMGPGYMAKQGCHSNE